MANIIDSLGADFINKRFQNAMFVREGEVYRLIGVMGRGKVVAKRVADGQDLEIDKDFFTGFKTFAYPKLGYRRMGEHYVAFCVKEQSAYRGLALERVYLQPSPATALLAKAGLSAPTKRNEQQIQIMRPVFDDKRELKNLFAGKRSTVVLNESLIVEPNTREADGAFDVFFDQIRVATVDDGKYKWNSPKYEHYITPLLAA